MTNIGYINGGNIAIKSAKYNLNLAGNSSIARPENMREVSRVKSVSSVVGLPNPNSNLSPKANKKGRSPSNGWEKEGL